MTKAKSVVLASFILAGCAQGPTQDGGLTVTGTVPYAQNAIVPGEVREACGLESNLAAHIRSAAGDEYPSVRVADRVTPTTPGLALTARIAHVLASEKTYRGPASLTVEGVLRRNGQVVGTFTARRLKNDATGTGAASGCGALLQLSRLVSRDVVAWTKSPGMNSKLGD
jgi:hypothetical protein